MQEEFAKHGIDIVAVSTNTRELAEKTVEEWGLDQFPIGFGMTLEQADQWGLFVSSAASEKEPPHFTEPGLFMITPEGTLYSSIVQTMPFSRPPAKALLSTMTWIIEKGYPARGEAVPNVSG